MDAVSFRQWGGVWSAPSTYSFVKTDNTQTNVTLLTQYNNWSYADGGVERRMPWLGINSGLLTTSSSSGSSWWGTLVSVDSSFHPAPWMGSEMPNPGIIWYWVR
jgi:hypothetical protein